MNSRSWTRFLDHLTAIALQVKPGRQQIRTSRDQLSSLVESAILPKLTTQDHESLFPLGYDPELSDLKIASGIGLERGWISPDQYSGALRADRAASPFSFLQTLSGKTFGETVAPLITQYWIVEPDDEITKLPPDDFFDLNWKPSEANVPIRIELKSSTEASPNFQQIRDPRMGELEENAYDYDILLCLGVSNMGIEWWVFNAEEVANNIKIGSFPSQHGGRKMASGTYWVRLSKKNRALLANHKVESMNLRKHLLDTAIS